MISELDLSEDQLAILQAYVFGEIEEIGVDPDEQKRMRYFVNQRFPGHKITRAHLNLDKGIWEIHHEETKKED